MCKGYTKRFGTKGKSRCTCNCTTKVTSLPRDIKNIIDVTPLKENMLAPYEDKYTKAFNYVKDLKKYNS